MMKKIIVLIFASFSSLLLISCEQKPINVFDFIIDESFDQFLVMGTSADYPPYQWLKPADNRMEIVGIDIEIGKLIAKEAGKNLRVINKAFDFLLIDLAAGKVDFVMSALSKTEEREKIVDFSNIYYQANQVILIHQDNKEQFNSLDDLNQPSIRIGAQLGSIQQDIVKETFPNASYQFIQSIQNLIVNLLNNQIKALILEEPVAIGFANNHQDLMILDLEIIKPDDGLAAAVQKGNKELLTIINRVIDEIIQSSQLNEIVKEMILLNS